MPPIESMQEWELLQLAEQFIRMGARGKTLAFLVPGIAKRRMDQLAREITGKQQLRKGPSPLGPDLRSRESVLHHTLLVYLHKDIEHYFPHVSHARHYLMTWQMYREMYQAEPPVTTFERYVATIRAYKKQTVKIRPCQGCGQQELTMAESYFVVRCIFCSTIKSDLTKINAAGGSA